MPQVYPAVTLSPSTAVPIVNQTPVTFTAAVQPLTTTTSPGPYAYTLDKGDGAGPNTCTLLPDNTATSGSAGNLTSTIPLADSSVTYSSVGVRMAVLRVYAASECAAGSAPTPSATTLAVGTPTIKVREDIKADCSVCSARMLPAAIP